MTGRAGSGWGRTIPAIPVRDLAAAAEAYRDRFGFTIAHQDAGIAVLIRDEAHVHLWEAGDTTWASRADLVERPVCSGAEDFIAGTASCRIEVEDVDAAFAELRAAGVLHPTSLGGVQATDFGTREFHTLDPDGNLLSFYRWVPAAAE